MPQASVYAQDTHKEGLTHMRSLLFVPGDSEKKQSKALSSGADALILDLEDSVAPSRKPAARAMTRAWLTAAKTAPGRPQLYVRINSLQSPFWQEDLAGVMAAAPDGIMHPKPRSGADVEQLALALASFEDKHNLPQGSTRILPRRTPRSAISASTSSGTGRARRPRSAGRSSSTPAASPPTMNTESS